MASLAVIVPAYNQAAQLRALLPRLPGTVLVVDDGSTDETALATSQVEVIRFSRQRGYGSALQAGFAWALEHGFERVVTLDGDGQHDPEELPRLLAVDTDIVSGSRFLPESPRRGVEPPAQRQSVNRAVLACLNALTGWSLTDAFCGFKAYRTESLRRLDLTEPGYGMPLQLWLQAHRAGLSVREVPVTCIYHSSQPGRPLQDYLRVLERELCSTCSR